MKKVIIALLLIVSLCVPSSFSAAPGVKIASSASNPVAMLTTFYQETQSFAAALQEIYTEETQQADTINFDAPVERNSHRLVVKGKIKNHQGAKKVASNKNGLNVLQFNSEQEVASAEQFYKNSSDVQYVFRDSVVTLDDREKSNFGIAVPKNTSSNPRLTWGADYMNVDIANDFLIDTFTLAGLPTRVVAVLDTGLDLAHPVFEGRIAGGAQNFSNEEGGVHDGHGHGTHVAGTIVDLTLENVKILPIKVLNSKGQGYDSGIIAGIEYVAELRDINDSIVAINMSLGLNSFPQASGGDPSAALGNSTHLAFSSAIDEAYNKGIVTVVAAGNESYDYSFATPANVENALTVGALTLQSGKLVPAGFSNYGCGVDVYAPGVFIESAKADGDTTVMSGTSMASPHVAAAVATLTSNPEKVLSAFEIKGTITAGALELEKATSSLLTYTHYGFRIPDAANFFDAGSSDYFNESFILESVHITASSEIENDQACPDNDSFTVTLTCAEPSASIYYTVVTVIQDYPYAVSVTPDNGILYTGPFEVSKWMYGFRPRVIAKAFVIDSGTIVKNGAESMRTYFFNYTLGGFPSIGVSTFTNWDDSVLKVSYYSVLEQKDGLPPDTPTGPNTPHYTNKFSGWNFSGSSFNKTYKAIFDSFETEYEAKITFKNQDGTTLDESWVKSTYFEGVGDGLGYVVKLADLYGGVVPQMASTVNTNYAFANWKPSGGVWESIDLFDELEVFANFTESARNYAITFKNHDGTILDIQTCTYQASISDSNAFFKDLYDGVSPHKSSTQTKKYTFNGSWRDEAGNLIVSVDSDQVIFAGFTESLRENLNTNTNTGFWNQVSNWFSTRTPIFWISVGAGALLLCTAITLLLKKKKTTDH